MLEELEGRARRKGWHMSEAGVRYAEAFQRAIPQVVSSL
jgi:hypothetical protein